MIIYLKKSKENYPVSDVFLLCLFNFISKQLRVEP